MTTIVLADTLRRYRERSGRTAWHQWLQSAAHRLHRALCGLHGHHFLIYRERLRICLECTHCGYQTHGWALTPNVAMTARLDPRASRRSLRTL